MAGQPIATLGSMHVCPMCSGYIPHVGGPVSGPGMPGATLNGQPIAVMGDMCVCAGPPDTIVQGCPGATINGKQIATVGCMTAHGGQITVGVPGATLGPAVPTPNTTMPLKEIPFPEIRFIDIIGAAVKGQSSSLKEAKENQEKIKQEAEEQERKPNIMNLRWVKEDKIQRNSKVIRQITLKASVSGMDDGETATIKVKKPAQNQNEDASDVVELSGTVQNNMVELVWELEDASQNQSQN